MKFLRLIDPSFPDEKILVRADAIVAIDRAFVASGLSPKSVIFLVGGQTLQVGDDRETIAAMIEVAPVVTVAAFVTLNVARGAMHVRADLIISVYESKGNVLVGLLGRDEPISVLGGARKVFDQLAALGVPHADMAAHWEP